jgi:hypothetical protein
LKNFPRIDPKLIEELVKLYPPIKYDPEVRTEDFIRMIAHHAGQMSVIEKLKQVCDTQEKKWRG